MDVFEYYMKEARRSLDAAEHMRSVSYPLAEDPKIFLGVVRKLYDCHKSILSLLLVAGECSVSIRECDLMPEKNFSMSFRKASETAKKENILEDDDLSLLSAVHDIILKHENSPVEFQRKQSFVMCDEEYGASQLTSAQAKGFSMRTKEILRKLFVKRDVFLSRYKESVESVAGKT
ncbi:MAG: hypothetical protein ACQESE_05285 [Nanobdellota archaeon]